ncbi:MAG: NADH-quinone oxidoreductase subunit C [Alphaproteobacteria bacterium]|nr:NADH-quinone oxidoreductase subunit C [Alphaproteobacteria bacterium]
MTAQPHIDTHLKRADLERCAELCRIALPRATVEITPQHEVQLTVPAADVAAALAWLKYAEGLKFSQLMDVAGVDYLGFTPAQPARFAVVYHLLSVTQNLRVRVKTYVTEGQGVPSVVPLWPAANWYERETYDMYGIVFTGHPDLRRILTDYDFIGHPLRKDFPLNGFTEVYYDAAQQRVAYKPVDLPQEFRHFDKVSEWRGMTGNAHLAETDNEFKREEFQ